MSAGKARKRMKSAELRELEAKKDRCEARHPNLYFIRCEVPAHMRHDIHYGEERNYVWTDD
jgi:hypothetical protein